jgi:hypothetical protein
MTRDQGSESDFGAALAPLAETLACDGYTLKIEPDLPRLNLKIVAGPDACADCLVPREMFGALATRALTNAGISTHAVILKISYPRDG